MIITLNTKLFISSYLFNSNTLLDKTSSSDTLITYSISETLANTLINFKLTEFYK